MTTLYFDIVLPEPNFPAVEVVTTAGTVDLHNFADFLGYEYSVSGNYLRLRWSLQEEDQFSRLKGRKVNQVVLDFGGVSQVSISPRDPEVPMSEDSALQIYQLLERNGEQMRFLFDFIGGAQVDIVATSVTLWAATR